MSGCWLGAGGKLNKFTIQPEGGGHNSTHREKWAAGSQLANSRHFPNQIWQSLHVNATDRADVRLTCTLYSNGLIVSK